MKNFINLLLLIAFSFSSIAQEKWDLQKCLKQAKENNLEILKQKLLIDVAKSNLKSSKLSLLPTSMLFQVRDIISVEQLIHLLMILQLKILVQIIFH